MCLIVENVLAPIRERVGPPRADTSGTRLATGAIGAAVTVWQARPRPCDRLVVSRVALARPRCPARLAYPNVSTRQGV